MKIRTRRRRLSINLTLILLTLFLAQPAAQFATPQQVAAQAVVARVTMRNQQELSQFVTLGLDLLEMRTGDDLFILTTQAQIDELRAKGWAVSVDQKQSALFNEQRANTFRNGYRTIAEMRAFIDSKVAAYPNLAEAFTYGQSWEKVKSGGTAGWDLFGITLTNKQITGPKPTFFLMAAIHARELTTSELALRFIDYLLTNYGIDGDATWLLDEHKIVIVPASNPDGRIIAEQGFFQRKNTNNTYGGGCPNPPTITDQYGVDLNRNANFKWGTVNPPTEPLCGQTYPGPTPASEPETIALQNLVRGLFADMRGPLDTDPAPMTTSGFFLTLHSYSNLVLWPWGWTENSAPNSTELAMIGQKFASYNSFTPTQSTGLYPTSGTTDDWAYGELGVPAMTFEVGPSSGTCGGFFPPFTCLDGGTGGSFWPRNLPAFLHAARIARAPYQLAHGPTPETFTTTAQPGSFFDLRAQLNEQLNGGQAISAAEYYIDTPPWRGGTGIAMTALDGSFNNTVETAAATIGPVTGRHLLFVRGRDSLGNWGPVRAVFVNGSACANTISPSAQALSAGGGGGTINLTAAAGCNWTAASNDSWLVITSNATGTGNAVITYEARENFAEHLRTGTITIAGQTFTMYQAGLSGIECNNSISPSAQSFSEGANAATINVFASPECVWSATSSAGWITITSQGAGTGNGSVSFSISANLGPTARKGTIRVAGRTFTVKQK
ncbi:MAG: M14 family zinc carboxypeptidase [Blastocatellia bacterium]